LQLFAFKGHFAHGWLGDLSMRRLDEGDTLQISTYFHQKSFYGRFGKPEWRIKLMADLITSLLGNENSFYGDIYTLTPFKSWLYVITGTPYGTEDIPRSKVGITLDQ